MSRRIRTEFPGIPPWEWEAHPRWYRRVIYGIVAEDDGRTIAQQAGESSRE